MPDQHGGATFHGSEGVKRKAEDAPASRAKRAATSGKVVTIGLSDVEKALGK